MAVEAWNPNHWANREFPIEHSWNDKIIKMEGKLVVTWGFEGRWQRPLEGDRAAPCPDCAGRCENTHTIKLHTELSYTRVHTRTSKTQKILKRLSGLCQSVWLWHCTAVLQGAAPGRWGWDSRLFLHYFLQLHATLQLSQNRKLI